MNRIIGPRLALLISGVTVTVLGVLIGLWVSTVIRAVS